MSAYNFKIERDGKSTCAIPPTLIDSRYEQFRAYYNIPHTGYFRDVFEPHVRMCIYLGSPTAGKQSAFKFSKSYIADIIQHHNTPNTTC